MSGIGLNSSGGRAMEDALASELRADEVVVAQGRADLTPYKGVAAYTKGSHVVLTNQRLLVFRRNKRFNPLVGWLAAVLPLQKPHLLIEAPLDRISPVQGGTLRRAVVGKVAQFATPDGRSWQLKPSSSGANVVKALNGLMGDSTRRMG